MEPMPAPASGAADPKPPWTFPRLLVVSGAALSILSPVAFLTPFVYIFIGPMLLPTIVALVLILTKDRAWTYLTCAIAGALFPLFVIFILGVAEGQFGDPLMRSEFIAILANVAALAILETGAVSGYLQAKKMLPMPSVKDGWKTVHGLFAIAVFCLWVGASITSALAVGKVGESGGGGYDLEPDATVDVVAQNTAFDPEEIAVVSGEITEIVVENRDQEFHTFTYDKNGTEYNHDVLPGQTAGFLVLFEAPGTVEFWCVPHSEGAEDDGSGMVGTITVT